VPFFEPGNGGSVVGVLIERLVKTGTGSGQLIDQGFRGFFKIRALSAGSAALKIGSDHDAGHESAGGCKKSVIISGNIAIRFFDFTRQHGVDGGKDAGQARECPALHHLDRSVD
jgi:hypothetical protein